MTATGSAGRRQAGRCRPARWRGGTGRGHFFLMWTVSAEVLSAGPFPAGVTLAVTRRTLPALALIRTVTLIVVDALAAIVASRLQEEECFCFWHCQKMPRPPWNILSPIGSFSVTFVRSDVAPVPVLVTVTTNVP